MAMSPTKTNHVSINRGAHPTTRPFSAALKLESHHLWGPSGSSRLGSLPASSSFSLPKLVMEFYAPHPTY